LLSLRHEKEKLVHEIPDKFFTRVSRILPLGYDLSSLLHSFAALLILKYSPLYETVQKLPSPKTFNFPKIQNCRHKNFPED